jgi:prepilin-type N-terminal cleavage/methylation domain-containing protein
MSHSFNKKNRGFSLTELLVSLSIVFIMIGVVVLNQNRYVEGASLMNLADELSLSIAQSQAYGIGVRQVTAGTSDFSAAYGVTASLLGSGSNVAFLFFADRNANTIYDGSWDCPTGGSNECVAKKDFTRGNTIYEICAVRTSGGDQCSNIGRVDITFKRPETDATITFYNTGGSLYVPPNLKGARITLRSANSLSRSVIVYLNGQISVQ